MSDVAVILFECPNCGRKSRGAREDTDPPNAVRMVLQCDRCDDGDRHSPEFFDAAGAWINPVAHLLTAQSEKSE